MSTQQGGLPRRLETNGLFIAIATCLYPPVGLAFLFAWLRRGTRVTEFRDSDIVGEMKSGSDAPNRLKGKEAFRGMPAGLGKGIATGKITVLIHRLGTAGCIWTNGRPVS